MRRSTEQGFSLLEAMVVVAIMAILAGAAVPLVLKALNQAREQKTRESMQIVWEAMFGSRNKRVANMRADFGFDPTKTTKALGQMTAPAAVGLYALDSKYGGLPWGWNGPYWTGSTSPLAASLGSPVDGWGNAFQLNYSAANPATKTPATWQLQGGGPNGVIGGAAGADDMFYPPIPVNVSSYTGTLMITVQRTDSSTTDLTVAVVVTDRSNGKPNNPPPVPKDAWGSPLLAQKGRSATYTVVPGPVYVQVTGGTDTSDQLIDLKPGETQTLTFQFD